jgi:hypothetical protein
LAAAQTRATEQRKRRRVQLALAASVLVLLGLVGFGLWWQERVETTAAAERAARDSCATAGVREALREARERAEEAWNLADFPERMQHATEAAVAALRRGDGFASSGAPDEISADLISARREVEELSRYTRLIQALVPLLPLLYASAGSAETVRRAGVLVNQRGRYGVLRPLPGADRGPLRRRR